MSVDVAFCKLTEKIHRNVNKRCAAAVNGIRYDGATARYFLHGKVLAAIADCQGPVAKYYFTTPYQRGK